MTQLWVLRTGSKDAAAACEDARWDSNFTTTWDTYLSDTRTRYGARPHRRCEDDRQFAVNERLAQKLALREFEAMERNLEAAGARFQFMLHARNNCVGEFQSSCTF